MAGYNTDHNTTKLYFQRKSVENLFAIGFLFTQYLRKIFISP